jgi:hypothetical protein
MTCLVVSPAFCLWLPWATEEAKVKKTLEEIWQALIKDDRKLVSQYLAGAGTENFIRQERDLIERLKIKEYECRVRSVQVDQATRQWAFVDLEKVAILSDGSTFVRRDLSVLQKINGLWRLVTEPLKRKEQPEPETKPQAEQASKGVGRSSPGLPETQPKPAQWQEDPDR